MVPQIYETFWFHEISGDELGLLMLKAAEVRGAGDEIPFLGCRPQITANNTSFVTMWTCPKCKHKFFNKNQSHSCGHYTIDDFLLGKTAKSVDLFRAFLSAYREIGPFELHPVKTRVALLTKMRFCAINKVGVDFIGLHLVLTKSFENTGCFYKIDNLANRFFVHHARLYGKSDINDELIKYMAMAYEIGNRAHVNAKQKG